MLVAPDTQPSENKKKCTTTTRSSFGLVFHLHGEVRDLVQPLDVLVVRRVPKGGVAEEQAAQDVGVTPGEHLGELEGGVTAKHNSSHRGRANDVRGACWCCDVARSVISVMAATRPPSKLESNPLRNETVTYIGGTTLPKGRHGCWAFATSYADRRHHPGRKTKCAPTVKTLKTLLYSETKTQRSRLAELQEQEKQANDLSPQWGPARTSVP